MRSTPLRLIHLAVHTAGELLETTVYPLGFQVCNHLGEVVPVVRPNVTEPKVPMANVYPFSSSKRCKRDGGVAKGAERGTAGDARMRSILTPPGRELLCPYTPLSSEDHNVCLYFTMGRLKFTEAEARPASRNSDPHIPGQNYVGRSVPVPPRRK